MRGIGNALTRKEIYFLVIYFLLDGLTNPSFNDFEYFFLLNVIGISKFFYAMLNMLGNICQVAGVLIYEQWLKNIEVRTVVFINIFFSIISRFFNYCFAMRWNVQAHISDYFFLIFTDVVFGSLQTAFQTLPILSLFAKIIPKRIEGTMYAFLTGALNLDQAVI